MWWAAKPPPPAISTSPRLVLLLSWDADRSFRDRITVAPITTNIRSLDAEVLLDQRDGLPRACAVNLDIMATILRTMLVSRVARLSDAQMARVERAMHIALGVRLPCSTV